MHTSAGVTSVIGFLGIVLMGGPSSGEPDSVKAQEVLDDISSVCHLYRFENDEFQPVTPPFKPPMSMTLVQRAYLSELCFVVSNQVFDYRREVQQRKLEQQEAETREAIRPPGAGTFQEVNEEELKLRKALDKAVQQHIEILTTLLEHAIRPEPFDEDGFWEGWLNERERYHKVRVPLIVEEYRLQLEQLRRRGDILRESRKADE